MVGGAHRMPDGSPGVMLIASTDLTHCELVAERVRLGELSWSQQFRYTVTTEMSDYVVIIAATWPDAFAGLFDQWQPPNTPAIASAVVPP